MFYSARFWPFYRQLSLNINTLSIEYYNLVHNKQYTVLFCIIFINLYKYGQNKPPISIRK